jgi:hypothetical protein
LRAEDTVCADLFGHAGDFFGECAETVDHFIDCGFDGGDFGEAGGETDALGEVAGGDGFGDCGDFFEGEDVVFDD